ncbi:MAG: hypothetical protein DCF28_03875 [Alphaproteobacteria bacterium]|nr:MAG: hypothetical protein DCF28_03875 [Alphaproteobacteria bacterium]PZO40286.1 MAG: hypothetical protein DCE92_02670 [Alphaproteobacteria bacterium]
MAARGMTGCHRLCVLQFPSSTETEWTDAIRRRASDIGWNVHDLAVAEEWPLEPPSGSSVFFTTEIEGVEKLDPTRWIILTEDPTESAAVVGASLGVDPFVQISLVRTSIRLASSASVAARETDVEVLDARAERLLLSDFGWVDRAPQTAAVAGGTARGPLDIFTTLPIPIGASADWCPTIFSYPAGPNMEGGTPDIDLTGRARLLLFGPYICLPKGLWSIDIDASIDTQTSTIALMFEWGAGDRFVSHRTSVSTAGQYRITLNRRWDVLEQAQVRIWLTLPLFQGRLTLNRCRVTRAADSTPETSAA